MRKLVIGTATCGVAAGAGKVLDHLLSLKDELAIDVVETGCIGLCYDEPLLEVIDGDTRELFSKVTPEIAEKLARNEDFDGRAELLLKAGDEPDRDGVLELQHRVALRR
mgnify:CR=1 FL=1